jgi:hypothetical protein
MKFISLIFLCLTFHGAWAAKFTIKSEPSGAEVVIQSAQGGEKFKLGVTPIEIDQAQIDAITKGIAYKIELTKANFEPNKILVASTAKEDILWNVVLVPKIMDKGLIEVDELISGLFEAQRLVRAKDYRGALYQLDSLEKKFPNVSSIFETKGSINYLTKNYNVALSEFRKAFSLNPANSVAHQMKIYLEEKLQKKDAE